MTIEQQHQTEDLSGAVLVRRLVTSARIAANRYVGPAGELTAPEAFCVTKLTEALAHGLAACEVIAAALVEAETQVVGREE